MYQYLKQPKDLQSYNLKRGVRDFANLKQFNLYESGYSYLVIVSVPNMLQKLADSGMANYFAKMWDAYLYALEYEFRGLEGLNDLDSEQATVTDGISEIQLINKVNMPSTSFSMRYFEKSGSLFTRVHETYLRGLRDPRTQVKHYNGLLANGIIKEAGFEHETFSFLYFVTDSTSRVIEKAYYLVGCQPTKAETNIYNSEKGSIEFKEITIEMTGFPIIGDAIDERAQSVLDWMNNPENPDRYYHNSYNFDYSGIPQIGDRYGVPNAQPNDPALKSN